MSNLFLIFAPLEGFRQVEVTDTRKSVDFAHICRDLVDVHFRDAEKITLVCDNLNTHKPASLYKTFPRGSTAYCRKNPVPLYAKTWELVEYG